MNVILLTSGTVCLIIILKIIMKVHHYYVIWQQLKNIPKTSADIIFGNTFLLMKLTETERSQWYISFMMRFRNGIFATWFGGVPIIHIFKPEYFEIILPSSVNIEKGIPYNMIRSWLGNGLLTSTGNQWFHDRRLIGPAFHFSILEQYAVTMSEKAEVLTKCLEREIEKNPGEAIDIFPFAINVALDVICETAMGVNLRAQETVIEYTETVHRATKLTMERVIRPWYWIEWLYSLTSAGHEFKSLLKKLHGFTKVVIDKKKNVRQSQNHNAKSENKENESDIDKRKRRAFLDLLLDQNQMDDAPLTNDELRAQVDTFMFEGHDTTAVAITWTLFCLGDNLEHQEKVHEELEEVFKDSQSPASMKELAQLKYLDRVIKETLRLYPSVPIISRKLAENVKIDDYTIPKGTTVALAIMFTHRNPQVWPDPLKFDPDRFLPENSRKRNPYAYVPFSAGPRNCIGQRFAQLEEKIILTAVLRKWRIKSVKTSDTINYGGTLILRPFEEVLLYFTPKK